MALQRDSHVALYRQIAEYLIGEITSGRYPPSGRLPSEQELMERYKVSRVTVRQAIGRLLDQGLVVRKQGKGTFVVGSLVRHELRGLMGFYDALVAQGLDPKTKLLDFRLVAPPEQAAEALGRGESELMFLRRLYSLEGAPIGLACTYLPPAAAKVAWGQAERTPSYAILDSLLDIRIARADLSIRGRLAGKELGATLKIAAKAPVLVLERVSYDAAGKPQEFTQFYVNSETYEFTLSAQGPLPISSRIKGIAADS